MPDATHSYLSSLDVDTAGGANYVAVASVVSINAPTTSVSATNATHLSSPQAMKEYVAGLIEPGEASMQLRFRKATYTSLLAALRDQCSWRIRFPDTADGTLTNGSTITWTGFILELGGPEASEDDTINQSFRVKVTGPITFTAGTG